MVDILLPVGRQVQGNLFEARPQTWNGQPKLDKNGQQSIQYYVGYAIAKNDPGWPAVWQQIQAQAAADFPGGESQWSTFAWKIIDGDLPEQSGKTGFPGHWVLKLTTKFDFQRVKRDAAGNIIPMPTDAKCGDYLRAYVNVVGNGDKGKPGVYINIGFIEHVGYGDAIVSGPDAAGILGQAGAAQLPPGASATPVGAAPGAPAPQQPPAPAPQQPPAPAPQQPPAPAHQQPPAPAPAPDFLNPPQMTAAAGGASYAQYKEKGWTDEQLIANGLMLPRQ